MQPEIEIVTIKKSPFKKTALVGGFILLLIILGFFSYRAYSLAHKVIASRSNSASPLLSEDIDLTHDLERLSEGDRRVNILLLGMGGGNHPGGELTDTIMVASIDVKNKSVAMISVPRDLYIPVKSFDHAKINSVYSLGKESFESEDRAIALVKETVSDFLGVPIHYYVRVDFAGFEKIIDLLGGVTVDVKKDLYDGEFPDKDMEGYDAYFISKGIHTLNGEDALKYARSRHSTSDFDRARRQQDIIVASREAALKKENLLDIKKMNEILTVLAEHIRTDLQVGEIQALAKIAKTIPNQNFSSKVIDDGNEGLLYADRYEEMYVLVPYDDKFTSVHQFVKQYFKDPFLSMEESRIAVRNGSGVVGVGQKLADELKEGGFNIVDVSNSEKKYTQTFMYDYSNNLKKYTIQFLQNRLKQAPVVQLDKEDKGYDIEIIIGQDYGK
ncbi:MAG: LCP family protein [Patescibacteria group bacterium]